ncbi:MAG TPA: hypothetical protein VE545_08355 [Candidatus Dormibacteraeota bacterium]|nr:hypothetical protein [Candidatus Dormibacteraeota bacterium]
MQRLFAMFPEGGPGVALLFLRVSAAAGFFLTFANGRVVAAAHWAFLCMAGLGAALCLGILTPIISILIAALEVVQLFISDGSVWLVTLLPIVNVAALALLGPGAYSIDAWLFGRRVLMAPPEHR